MCEYACELWEGEESNAWVNMLETIQYSCGKAALGLHGSPAAVEVRAELGLEELRFRRQALKLRWWARLCDAPQERLMSLLFRRRHEEVSAGGARFSGLRSLRELLTRARCVLCGDGTETVQHFVNDCKFLAPCRDRMMRELHFAVPLAGEAGAWRVHVMRLSRGALLNYILARPDAVEAVNEMEGFVDWLVENVIKNCLDDVAVRGGVGRLHTSLAWGVCVRVWCLSLCWSFFLFDHSRLDVRGNFVRTGPLGGRARAFCFLSGCT